MSADDIDSNGDSSQMLDTSIPERRHYKENWAHAGVTAILKHLLMDRCKFNPKQHRLQYAFMLFRAVTMQNGLNETQKKFAGSQRFQAILQENMVGNGSHLSSSHPAGAMNLSVGNHSVIEDKHSDSEEDIANFPIEEKNMDWFELYWKGKRGDYFSSDTMTSNQLK